MVPLFFFFTSDSKTFVIIVANPKTLNAKKFINAKIYNVAKPQWLVRALGSDEPLTKLIQFKPDDMFFATETLKAQFAEEVDEYDDSEAPHMIFEKSSQSLDRVRMNEFVLHENLKLKQNSN